jgi:hypothetical protein
VSNPAANPSSRDERWGDYVPWFLRHSAVLHCDDFLKFFSRASQRLERMFTFNEAGHLNLDHLGSRIETDSLQRYQHRLGIALGGQLKYYFDSGTIYNIAAARAQADPDDRRLTELVEKHQNASRFTSAMYGPESDELVQARQIADRTRSARVSHHLSRIIPERLGVLEVVLVVLAGMEGAGLALQALTRDLRRALAEAHIPLDIRGTPPQVVALDERLLQEAVWTCPVSVDSFPSSSMIFVFAVPPESYTAGRSDGAAGRSSGGLMRVVARSCARS